MAQIGLLIGSRHDPVVLFAWTLLACGFFIKGAIVPFHFWLPDAHAVAPTPVCVLFSGLMVELGLYAVLRLHVVVFQQAITANAVALRMILLCLGALTALVGGVMCYAEHHLKRLLAFSTISHAGLMLMALALQTPLAIAGMLFYLLAHALVKSGLFFTSGILLHRLRTISEPLLFTRGKPLRFTAALWFFGALGLAGVPPFSTLMGEAFTSQSAESLGLHWPAHVFILSGLLTAAAVLRVGMHTFLGWGKGPISDRAAEVGELPETTGKNKIVLWCHFTPAVICILGAASVTFVPHLRTEALRCAIQFSSQAGYVNTIYGGNSSFAPLQDPVPSVATGAIRGFVAGGLAILLACTSVFRTALPRSLRLGAFLEGPLAPLRAAQSGNYTDYVMWITVGIAALGCAFMFLLR